MTTPRNIVIVGGRPRRRQGRRRPCATRAIDGRLVLLGEEHRRPYERPPLSKDYLRGEAELDVGVRPRAGATTTRSRSSCAPGREATAIDRAAHEVELDDGERLAWDRLLIATGAEPRRLPLPGADLDGVLYLRSVEDSDRLREAIAARRPAGGGRRRVDRLRGGRVRAPGGHGGDGAGAAGRPARDACSARRSAPSTATSTATTASSCCTGVEIEALEGDGRRRAGAPGRRAHDRLRGRPGRRGRRRRAPRSPRRPAWRWTTGSWSTACCARAPDVFAAGDVANVLHPFYGRRVRVEHWANALNQGPAAARNMLGREEPYDRLPYFFSDQYDVGMEYSGLARGDDEVVIRGDLAARELIAFWLVGRPGGGGHERQRLGRDRADPGPHPLARPGRPHRAWPTRASRWRSWCPPTGRRGAAHADCRASPSSASGAGAASWRARRSK